MMAILIACSETRLSGVPGALVALVVQLRRAALLLASGALRVDDALRECPAAGLALVAGAIVLGVAMLAAH